MPLTTTMQVYVDGRRSMCSACDCYMMCTDSQASTCVLARANCTGLAAGGTRSPVSSKIESISDSSGAAAADSKASTAAIAAASSDCCLAGRPRLFAATAVAACAVCAGSIPVGTHGVPTTTLIQALRIWCKIHTATNEVWPWRQ